MELTLTQPDDWHLHLRDGSQLRAIVQHSARQFARAIIMPNLKPPVQTLEQALAYRDRILDAARGLEFEPLMTLYLTPQTSPREIIKAAHNPHVHAVKLYPAGATTNSEAGVSDLTGLYPVLQAMSDTGLVLSVHGESTHAEVDIFDREARFLEETLTPLLTRFPDLRVVLEHITTEDAVRFVRSARPGVAATITAHHLLYNRNAIFQGGVRPDLYCLPILKRERHRRALVEAATSGDSRFFLGTDSAPHARSAKYAACGCAGVYTAHAALEFYAQVFEQAKALHRLEAFASRHGAEFYELPLNTRRIKLLREDWQVPCEYSFGQDVVTPLAAGETLRWRLLHGFA
jgi:dihydroorotase